MSPSRSSQIGSVDTPKYMTAISSILVNLLPAFRHAGLDPASGYLLRRSGRSLTPAQGRGDGSSGRSLRRLTRPHRFFALHRSEAELGHHRGVLVVAGVGGGQQLVAGEDRVGAGHEAQGL